MCLPHRLKPRSKYLLRFCIYAQSSIFKSGILEHEQVAEVTWEICRQQGAHVVLLVTNAAYPPALVQFSNCIFQDLFSLVAWPIFCEIQIHEASNILHEGDCFIE